MKKLLAIAAAALLPTLAQAAPPVFADDFNGNTYGLNKTPTGWSILDRGTVDVVGTGGFGYLCAAGGGMCIDLDGSSGDAGILSRNLSLTAGTTYTAYFDIAGSQRGGSESLLVSFGTATLLLDPLASGSPWTTYSLTFTPTASGSFGLTFNNAGGDNMGAMLDNVSVVAVPEPESYALLLAGLGLMGTVARRRARKQA